MYKFQKVDFESIRLKDRPGGWLEQDFPFDADSHVGDEEIEEFLTENPPIMLEAAVNLFYNRELGASMTRMFYIFEKDMQTFHFMTLMNSVFERLSAWYEMDETGRRYLLIQADGISEAAERVFENLKERGALEPMIQRLYLDSHFSNDMTASGYYCLKQKLEEEQEPHFPLEEERESHFPLEVEQEPHSQPEQDSLIRQLFQYPDFRNYGTINVSGLCMEELEKDPLLGELQEMADSVYLYIFDLCMRCEGTKEKKYVKILKWNVNH